MGIEPFLVSSSLECLVAQRLVRLICPKCKIPAKNKNEVLLELKGLVSDLKTLEIFEGKGCETCRFTGYLGRTGIHEILIMTEQIREMILQRASSQQIKQKAIAEQGMRTLRQDGLKKVIAGLTTYSEVVRVTQQEELPEE